MSLKYALLEAHLTPAPDDYVAQVQGVKSHNLQSIIEKMVQKGSTITKTDIVAVFNSFFEVITDITKEGETINLDAFKTSLSMQGVFDSATDSYDPKRHTIKVNAHTGQLLKDALQHITVEKTATPAILPHILEVKDTISQSVNDAITSGGVVEIVGSILKIAGDSDKNGVFFVDSDNKAHKASTLVDNKPARLIVIAPTLTKGDYTLQVTTQYSGGGVTIKTPRTGIYGKHLAVA